MEPSILLLTTLREILDGRLTKKKLLPSRLTEEEIKFCERSLDFVKTFGAKDLPKLNKWLTAYEDINRK